MSEKSMKTPTIISHHKINRDIRVEDHVIAKISPMICTNKTYSPININTEIFHIFCILNYHYYRFSYTVFDQIYEMSISKQIRSDIGTLLP